MQSLTNTALKKRLGQYKYISPPLSLFERLFLNEFWNWVAATFYPRWLAPNMVTLTGFLCFALSTVAQLYHSPGFDGNTPHWWLLLAAIMGFLYQTMDGSDGKHARNIRGGSPLGEMFDHGCDAVITPFYPLITIEIFRVGISHWLGLLAPLAAQTTFFLSNLTLLHKGRQTFQDFDCQEAQVMIQIFLLISYLFGRSVYDLELVLPTGRLGVVGAYFEQVLEAVPSVFHIGEADYSHPHRYTDADGVASYGFELRWIIVFGCTIFACITSVGLVIELRQYYTNQTMKQDKTTQDTPLKEGQGLANLDSQICAMCVHAILMCVSWVFARDYCAGRGHQLMWCVWLLLVVLSSADLANRALLTRVTQVPFPSLFEDVVFWCLLVFSAGCYADLYPVCLVAAGVAIGHFAGTVVSISRPMCKALGRKMFLM